MHEIRWIEAPYKIPHYQQLKSHRSQWQSNVSKPCCFSIPLLLLDPDVFIGNAFSIVHASKKLFNLFRFSLFVWIYQSNNGFPFQPTDLNIFTECKNSIKQTPNIKHLRFFLSRMMRSHFMPLLRCTCTRAIIMHLFRLFGRHIYQ